MADTRDVHTEHCCLRHGCKYCKADCTVVTKQKKQSFPCEACHYEEDEIDDLRARLAESEQFRVEHGRMWSEKIRQLCDNTGIDATMTEAVIIDAASRMLREQKLEIQRITKELSKIKKKK